MRFEGRQITCRCGAYKFPHRLNGGQCTGSHWAELYFYTVRVDCDGCISNCGSHCEVATGQESIDECQAVHEALRSGDVDVVVFS